MRIYLIGFPSFDVGRFLEFLQGARIAAEAAGGVWRRTATANSAEELVEAAGRVCYMSFGKDQSDRTNQEYIENLIANGHESVLEHVSWTFVIDEVSRSLTHQLVRHRVGFAFSQLSQQYHEERDARFIAPWLLERVPAAEEAWRIATETAIDSYQRILSELECTDDEVPSGLSKKEKQRAIRSAARSVLPNATATTVVATINARALRHFLTVRGSIPGDEEMRRLAKELLLLVREEAPSIFSDFDVATLDDGSPMVVRKRDKMNRHPNG